MYIPNGGPKIINIWLIFSFVAIWHDFKIKLIIWGSLCSDLLTPEIFIRKWYNQKKFNYLKDKLWWKYLGATGGSIGIGFLIFANLIGFGIG